METLLKTNRTLSNLAEEIIKDFFVKGQETCKMSSVCVIWAKRRTRCPELCSFWSSWSNIISLPLAWSRHHKRIQVSFKGNIMSEEKTVLIYINPDIKHRVYPFWAKIEQASNLIVPLFFFSLSPFVFPFIINEIIEFWDQITWFPPHINYTLIISNQHKKAGLPELSVHPPQMVQAQYQEKGKDGYLLFLAVLPVHNLQINDQMLYNIRVTHVHTHRDKHLQTHPIQPYRL